MNELVAALDDLLQAGAKASSALRSALERAVAANPQALPRLNAVAVAQGVLAQLGSAPRTEQSLPGLVTAARNAVAQLRDAAAAIGDSQLANSLAARVQAVSQLKGVGFPWLTVLGVGAGAAALYYLWRHYRKQRIATFERPEPEDPAPRIRQMGRSLGALRGQAFTCGARRGLGGRGLGAPPRAQKYEFEPEIRLEGYRRRFKKARRP